MTKTLTETEQEKNSALYSFCTLGTRENRFRGSALHGLAGAPKVEASIRNSSAPSLRLLRQLQVAAWTKATHTPKRKCMQCVCTPQRRGWCDALVNGAASSLISTQRSFRQRRALKPRMTQKQCSRWALFRVPGTHLKRHTFEICTLLKKACPF